MRLCFISAVRKICRSIRMILWNLFPRNTRQPRSTIITSGRNCIRRMRNRRQNMHGRMYLRPVRRRSIQSPCWRLPRRKCFRVTMTWLLFTIAAKKRFSRCLATRTRRSLPRQIWHLWPRTLPRNILLLKRSPRRRTSVILKKSSKNMSRHSMRICPMNTIPQRNMRKQTKNICSVSCCWKK